ncbi:hypothetical protein MKX03_022227 [Papaver bracteatum]|nr:hypothetical protein MKX03_022227 [Papaver bracteatum]
MNFVDRKISLHHDTGDIKKFCLDANNSAPKLQKLEEWLSALFTRHNLEEFVFYAENSLEEGFFPSSGRYASLVIMELDAWDPLYLPGAINSPSLKIFKLSNARLYMYSMDPTQQFFTNLPVLEKLELTDCQYTDLSADDFILHRFESPVDVEIGFERRTNDMPLPQENVPITTKVLKKLSNVKRLKIFGETFEELLFPDDLFTNWPMFHNLVRLEVTSGIFLFLRISPNLKTIGFVGHRSSTYSGWTPDMVPQCMLLHLKSVKLCGFNGCSENINAVKTILKNARVLRRLIIKFRSNISTGEQIKVMKKLLKFPRGSPRCEIQVS